MKIGYCVEGSTDRALLTGFKQRWCPNAELIPGRFRGSTKLRLRAEIPQICQELDNKGCTVMVFLTDANTSIPQDVLRIAQAQQGHVPVQFSHRVLSGVTARNVECWLCADSNWIAGETGRTAAEFDVENPKGVLEAALGINSRDRKEELIASLVQKAPVKQWILRSRSFERFYDDARNLGQTSGCAIPNER